jgi:hypothetical protein
MRLLINPLSHRTPTLYLLRVWEQCNNAEKTINRKGGVNIQIDQIYILG